jgi:hypothetical protein
MYRIALTALTAIILTLTNIASADVYGGPERSHGVLGAGGIVTYGITLSGGLTIFRATGDGDGDIDCALLVRGQEVARDVGPEDSCQLIADGVSGLVGFVVVNSGTIATVYSAVAY